MFKSIFILVIAVCNASNSYNPKVYSFPGVEGVSAALDKLVTEASNKAIKNHSRFTVALSGGSLPHNLAAVLKNNKKVDFSKWHVFFADERSVPLDHEDSNYLLAKKELLDFVPIPPNQVYTINNSLVNNTSEAAKDYERQLVKFFKPKNKPEFPTFDLIFLGIGPDGHTCSLFPGHPLLDEKKLWVAPIENSPKPPPRRITLTYPILNHADTIAFEVVGDYAQDILVKILDNKDQSIPATRVNPKQGQLYWFLDDKASAKLKKTQPLKKF